MNNFTIREKVIIKLIAYLIEIIGKKIDGFYPHQLKECLEDIYKQEKESEK